MAKLLKGVLKPAKPIVPLSISSPAAIASTVLKVTARAPFRRSGRLPAPQAEADSQHLRKKWQEQCRDDNGNRIVFDEAGCAEFLRRPLGKRNWA
jgi:hypothetical protein